MTDRLAPLADVRSPCEAGERACRFGRLRRAGLPVPDGFVVSAAAAADWSRAGSPVSGPLAEELRQAVAELEGRCGEAFGRGESPLLLAVRQSARGHAFGLRPALLNVGLGRDALPGVSDRYGEANAARLRCEFIQAFACTVLNAESEEFDGLRAEAESRMPVDWRWLSRQFDGLIQGAGLRLPTSPISQLAAAVACLSRPRRGMSAGQAVLVQRMVADIGGKLPGQGALRSRKPADGAPDGSPSWRSGWRRTGDRASPNPGLPLQLRNSVAEMADAAEAALGGAVSARFVSGVDGVWLVDVDLLRLEPTAQAAFLRESVERERLTRQEAVLRLEPLSVERTLHARVDPEAPRTEIGRGFAAAPGAATGELVFSSSAAEHLARRGGHPVLARAETNPADVGAMHFAQAVVTSRGGMTSHAAVVTRALGRPCVAGATNVEIDAVGKRLRTLGGTWYGEGSTVTVDGTTGRLLVGAVPILPARFDGAMAEIVGWADAFRRMQVRANADTPADARLALSFQADGIGLCRSEHMFFEKGRIAAMREMILAGSEAERRHALDNLLPMQLEDLRNLFLAMNGKPVVVRLLDPPLHEFLPSSDREMLELAERMKLPVAQVAARAQALREFNPMLGNRGCRLAIVCPEIYDMQAEAILRAALAAESETGVPSRPEIMVPLVSAQREMEILRKVIDKAAARVAAEAGRGVAFKVGAMIETPRAALRSDAIGRSADFLSYGTNDLTQMAFGLSRDDAGRFMPQYLRRGVYDADPFVTLDQEGVGEMVRWSVQRSRDVAPDIALGLCGEHGADPDSIAFCETLGMDYVSCSPFRLPVARLAAAQATINRERGAGERCGG